MKPIFPPGVEPCRITVGPWKSGPENGFNGAFQIPCFGETLNVIVSDGGGWDHVSVSLRNRCPTFKELSFIKALFWDPEETVVHFFPKLSSYVNRHPFCLHLWKRQGAPHELPPSIFVG